jgi:MFS family permease
VSHVWIVGSLSLSLVLAQAGSMTFPALMPRLMTEWSLSETEAGLVAGMYFAGYAFAVLPLAALTDRIDARPLVAFCAVLAGVSVLLFAFWVEGFWLAAAMRFLTGIGIAGVHMPGMTLLAGRLDGPGRQRGSAIYAACYALGTANSFLIAGLTASIYGWRVAFIVSGVMPLLVPLLLVGLGAPHRREARSAPRPTALLDFRPVVRNREALAYILAYAGNTWEVFGVRAWFVTFLAFSMALPGNSSYVWNAPVLSAVSALLGVFAGIALAEVSARGLRRTVITTTALSSVAVALAIAGTVEAATPLVVALLLLHGMTSYADAPSISSGVVEAAEDGYRGATLAVFALAGFLPGLVAPLVIGMLLQTMGGAASSVAWTFAFLVLALGSVVSAAAMRLTRSP